MLFRQGNGDDAGLIGLAGFVHNDPQNLPYAEQYFVGLIDKHFWAARPEDGVGLLFTYNSISGQLGKVQAAEEELGLPFSNGATGIQTHEMVLEANYDIHVTRGLNFQPELEYVVRPNAQSNIRDALVLGFKTHVTF